MEIIAEDGVDVQSVGRQDVHTHWLHKEEGGWLPTYGTAGLVLFS